MLDFWTVHPSYDFLILIGCALFPRITMLFLGGGPGYVLTSAFHWIGWVFAPHITVAVLATTIYWDSNPLLCVLSWFFSFAGTSGEGGSTYTSVKQKLT